MHVYVGARAPNAKYDAHATYLLDISYFFLLPSITVVHLGPWDSIVSILHLFICLCEFLGPLHLNPKGSKNKIPQFSSSTTMYQRMVHCLPPTSTHAKPTHYWIPLLIMFSQARTFPHTVGQIEKTNSTTTTCLHNHVSSSPKLHSHSANRAWLKVVSLLIPNPPFAIGVFTLSQLTKWCLNSSHKPPNKRFLCNLSILLATLVGIVNKDK